MVPSPSTCGSTPPEPALRVGARRLRAPRPRPHPRAARRRLLAHPRHPRQTPQPRHRRDPRARQLIDLELQALLDRPDGRLIVELPPQEGKSTRVAKDFIVWVLKHRPWTRVVGASYGQGLANRNGRSIRNLIRSNPDLGLQLAADNGSASEWQLAGHDGGLVSVGIGAGLTGRPADLMVIDDPIKDRREADSETYRDRVGLVDRRRLHPPRPRRPGGADPDQVARGRPRRPAPRRRGRPPVEGLRIPAQADHDPEKGETDPLGREPGEFLESARGRTAERSGRRSRPGSGPAPGTRSTRAGPPRPRATCSSATTGASTTCRRGSSATTAPGSSSGTTTC
jgi:hypothetical protein